MIKKIDNKLDHGFKLDVFYDGKCFSFSNPEFEFNSHGQLIVKNKGRIVGFFEKDKLDNFSSRISCGPDYSIMVEI